MFTYIKRIFGTSFKHIKRNPWLSVASIAVIMLAFFLSSIFGTLLYGSNIILNYLETQSHIYTFFKNGTEEEYILDLKKDIENYLNPELIEYTSEEDALKEFKEAYSDNPLILESITDDVLPASLGVRARTIEDIPRVLNYLNDVQENDGKIETIKYREDVTQRIQRISEIIRFSGAVIVSFLVAVSFLMVLISVSIGISSYHEEIKIMQLVGASRGYVRWPFVLTGAIYGALGTIFSTATLVGFSYAAYYYLNSTGILFQLTEFFRGVPLPQIGIYQIIIIIIIKISVGIIIGAMSSIVSTKKYIK